MSDAPESGPSADVYDLEPIKAPTASGASLKMLCGLVESKVTGGMLAGTLLKNAGVLAFRQAVTDEHHPLGPPMPYHPRTEPAPAVPGEVLEALARPEAAPGEDGFAFETVADYRAAYREGRTTPVQVAERVLAACEASEAMQPAMRFFIAQDKDDLMAQAKASAERWAAGKPKGVLDGVPVAVKDELDQAGYPTTVGTRFLGTAPAEADAFAVAKLRAAGAVLTGKANMHEIGLGVTGVNPHHGPARNPYDPARATGGSSSGPAAAVAAGLGPVSLGADGGGSIRIPAGLCGLTGLKATFGRVSETGAAPLCWSVAHVGPLAASARDCAIGYGLMAGTDPADPNSLGQPDPSLDGFADGDLSGLKLGVFEPWIADAEPDVVAAFRKTLEGLVAAGAQVVPVEVPELSLLRVVHMVTIVGEMSAAHMPYIAAGRKRYGHDTRLNLSLAGRLTAADYVHAQRLRVRLSQHFYGLLEEVDAIVTPTTACAAPVIAPKAARTGESNLGLLEQIMRYAPAANLTGCPAISFPAGYTAAGLPVGFQAMGRLWQEHTLLRLAAVAEGFVPRRAPQVHYRLLAE